MNLPGKEQEFVKKKNLKSIDFMRQKVKSKNLKYNFFRIDKEKSIEIFNDAGWHFNNVLSPEEISLKLKTYAHSEFAEKKYSDPDIIRKKINEKIDLFNRGHTYEKIEINNSFPKYLTVNLERFKKYII